MKRDRQLRGVSTEIRRAALRLRKEMTPAEKLLWECLKDRRLDGLKFRRQHAVGSFVLDFFCAEQKLVVEVDGSVHNTLAQRMHDATREAWLEEQGYRVLRVTNAQVQQALPQVLQTMRAACGTPS